MQHFPPGQKPESLCHFPVMQQNILNSDVTVSGYTLADDSACITKVDSNLLLEFISGSAETTCWHNDSVWVIF